MKRSVLIVAIILIVGTLFACTANRNNLIGTWEAKGSILGLDEQIEEYDIYLTFNDESSATLTYEYTDAESEKHTFKYKTEGDYLIVLSYAGEELTPENHKYKFSINNSTLTLEVNNQHMKYERIE